LAIFPINWQISLGLITSINYPALFCADGLAAEKVRIRSSMR